MKKIGAINLQNIAVICFITLSRCHLFPAFQLHSQVQRNGPFCQRYTSLYTKEQRYKNSALFVATAESSRYKIEDVSSSSNLTSSESKRTSLDTQQTQEQVKSQSSKKVSPNDSKKERQKSSPKMKKTSSNRLNKARRLLNEYETNIVEDGNTNLKRNNSTVEVMKPTIQETKDDQANSSPSTEAQHSIPKSTQNKLQNDTHSNLTDADPIVPVPDSYWSNAHLQGSGDYVARWAGGVKVAEPLIQYDPITAEKSLFRQPTKWVLRNIQIALPLGLWASGVIVDLLTGQEENNRRSRAQQLLRTITGLGPAIIKGGQALSSRPDLLPSEYLEELQKLQDDVPRYENGVAFSTVEEELDIEFGDVFELLQDEPVAAASIGQVYKARLLSNGDTVALKIQRPRCEEITALDLYVLRWWSGVATSILKALGRDIDVQNIIDDFGELIYRELDYVAEAANAQRFTELYAGVTDVFVPKVYSDLTTRRVLTMEWVDGYRLTDNDKLTLNGLDKKKLLDTLIQCSLRQILENGFFHADPHAGNLLACPDGRLCYLDFGMMSYAKASQRNGFLLAIVHVVNRDWEELVQLYQRLGFIPEGTDLAAIEVALEKALPDVLNADVAELNFKNVINKLSDIFYTYPFSLPPFYISIIRCLGVLEGLAIQVDPQTRVISEAYPYIASRVLTDPQDDLQEAFRRLAFTSEGNIRWNRLEGLLEEAQESSGYDVTVALDQLTDYMISDDGEKLLKELSEQLIESADTLGTETITYLIAAFQALLIDDEVALARTLQSIQIILDRQTFSEEGQDPQSVQEEIEKNLQDVLPELPISLKQMNKILALLRTQAGKNDPSRFLPLIRKLSQEPRVGRYMNMIILSLGERVLSRGLRAAFGLPQPQFKRDVKSKDEASSKKEPIGNNL